jgi:hypothetical protein
VKVSLQSTLPCKVHIKSVTVDNPAFIVETVNTQLTDGSLALIVRFDPNHSILPGSSDLFTFKLSSAADHRDVLQRVDQENAVEILPKSEES